MRFAPIMSVIMSFIIMALASCSSDDSSAPSMICKISRKAGDCTAVPTLSSGQLTIMPDRQFALKGHYSACFHEEVVSIHGKYQRSDYNKGISIELLATNVKGLKSSEFPATIAVIRLEKSSLKGVISDVWATIRSPEQSHSKPEIEISCKPSGF